MEFNNFINKCWERHRAEPEAVAAELAENLGQVDSAQAALIFCNIVNHVFGFHLSKWADASDLCEKALHGREQEDALAVCRGNS